MRKIHLDEFSGKIKPNLWCTAKRSQTFKFIALVDGEEQGGASSAHLPFLALVRTGFVSSWQISYQLSEPLVEATKLKSQAQRLPPIANE